MVGAGPIFSPSKYLVAATAALIASALLFVAQGDLSHLIGWMLGSVVCIGLLTMYTSVDQRRRLSSRFSPRPHLARIRICIAVLAVMVSVLHAWPLAWSLSAR
jgi:hypothetical protein